MAAKSDLAQKTKKEIQEANAAIREELAEKDPSTKEELDMFSLMKGDMRLRREYLVGRDLVFKIASLGTEHSLLARRLALSANPDHKPNDPQSPASVVDRHRLNSYHLALSISNVIYRGTEDDSYPGLPDRIPENRESVSEYLAALQKRKEYIEALVPGVYDRALGHLSELAEEVERLSSPEALENF